MKTTQIKTDIKFREVYLSDLTSVVNLYLNGSTNKLTSDFGLPVGIAEQAGKVIACSLVNINSEGKPTFSILRKNSTQNILIYENLNSFSVNRFISIWGPDIDTESGVKPVKNAINRLVDWLNHCS